MKTLQEKEWENDIQQCNSNVRCYSKMLRNLTYVIDRIYFVIHNIKEHNIVCKIIPNDS